MPKSKLSSQPLQSHLLKSFYTIWISQFISLAGSRIVQFAIIWWLTKTTGSANVLVTASLVGLLPVIIFSPFIGTVVDRFNRRLILIISDGLIAIITAILAILFFYDQVQIHYVYIILCIRSIAEAFHRNAMRSSVSLMVPENLLTKIQGYQAIIISTLDIFSAPLGAILLELIPIYLILIIDIGSALFAIMVLLFLDIPNPIIKEKIKNSVSIIPRLWQDFLDGINYILSKNKLREIILLVSLVNFFLYPAFILLPLLVKNIYQGGAKEFAIFESCFGIGMAIGGAILIISKDMGRKIIYLGLSGIGIGYVLVGDLISLGIIPAITGILIVGISCSIMNSSSTIIIQKMVPSGLQGRVFTIMTTLTMSVSPLGLLLAGPLSEIFGCRPWYLITGIICIFTGIICLLKERFSNNVISQKF
jgi:MFS transporter, DHA3 family, macrolide efflux protein